MEMVMKLITLTMITCCFWQFSFTVDCCNKCCCFLFVFSSRVSSTYKDRGIFEVGFSSFVLLVNCIFLSLNDWMKTRSLTEWKRGLKERKISIYALSPLTGLTPATVLVKYCNLKKNPSNEMIHPSSGWSSAVWSQPSHWAESSLGSG